MVYNDETFNSEFEADAVSHIQELKFKIECLWRQHDDLMAHPNGIVKANKLADNISYYEAALRDLGGMS